MQVHCHDERTECILNMHLQKWHSFSSETRACCLSLMRSSHKRWHHVGSAWVFGAQLAICHFESVTLAYIYFWRWIFYRALCCVQVTSSIVGLTPGRKKKTLMKMNTAQWLPFGLNICTPVLLYNRAWKSVMDAGDARLVDECRQT